MKNKLLLCLITLLLCFTLIGCGTKEKENKENETTNDLKSVSIKNYKNVTKELFGINIIDIDNWEIEKVESPNKVNNLNIDYKITSQNGKEILEKYYKEVLKITQNGIYSYGFNDSYQVVKENKYNSFEEIYKDSSSYGTFHQMSFIYDYNGKNIQLSMTIDEKLGTANISFVYC